MSKNYMKEVAEMLGVEFGEKFEIENIIYNPYHINENGLYNCDNDHCYKYLSDLLKGEKEIKKTIITDKEREYLSNVTAPKSIYENVDYIAKTQTGKYFRIVIIDKQGVRSHLPCFENEKMYKGMELNKIYTLKELGVSRDE